MEKHTFGNEYGFQTRAVHTGNDIDAETGAIKRPITMANSYALPYDPSDLNWSSAGKNLYTRNGGSNQQYLQEKLASLEGGEDCVVLASGVAALSGLFFALLESGDHVVFSSVTYIAVYRLLNELLKNKFHVDTTIVDTSDLEAVKKGDSSQHQAGTHRNAGQSHADDLGHSCHCRHCPRKRCSAVGGQHLCFAL